MSSDAQKPPVNGQQPKPQAVPKEPLTIDHILAQLSKLPLLYDEDNDEITVSTRNFALLFVSVLEINDANLLRALLRRRQVSSKFEEAFNTPG